jgi:ABC-type multidrug transport system fused ATPase/permease subunit
VALVGPNGSGKSTIGLLATRLCHPDSGSILIGGRDIQDVGRRSLRTNITLVPQDPFFFDTTIRENLLYGNPRATISDLDEVISLARLDVVVNKLPKGLDEQMGRLGKRLSGGEKKRVALARALLQGSKILILDEITSALDGPAAAELLKGLDVIRLRRTLLVISHRPTTIQWADRILVIEKGSVKDSGQHADLIKRCDLYQKICRLSDHGTSTVHSASRYDDLF